MVRASLCGHLRRGKQVMIVHPLCSKRVKGELTCMCRLPCLVVTRVMVGLMLFSLSTMPCTARQSTRRENHANTAEGACMANPGSGKAACCK